MTLKTDIIVTLSGHSLTVSELAHELDRSPASIRSALERLRKRRVVDRIHVFPFRYELSKEKEGN